MNTPSWTADQQARLATLLEADPATTWIGYYCTDQWGRPANGGDQSESVHARLTQELDPPLKVCARGFHATRAPHRWAGCRVWIVALHGPRQERDDKAAALRREIVGEVLPSDVLDPSLAVRMGVRLAYLTRANLEGANLEGAYLGSANLAGANLAGAYRPGWLPAQWTVMAGGVITSAT